MCLESVFSETEYPNFEVIAVDNASHDGTAEWLADEATRQPRLRVIRNAEQPRLLGSEQPGAAHGPRPVPLPVEQRYRRQPRLALDHDRTPAHVAAKSGMIGPVSNMVGNEAKIPVGYTAIADMPRWAADYCRRHDGETAVMKMLGFFCVLLRREVYEKVGEMDEQFGVGFFEDTDYCYRAARAGYQLLCRPRCLRPSLAGSCVPPAGARRPCQNLPAKPTPVRIEVGRRQHGGGLLATVLLTLRVRWIAEEETSRGA